MNSLQLEKIIGYRFKNREYLERALTHSSFNREKNTKHKDNERLEFLGDAFLDAVISVELFRRMPEETEGKLTKTRALIVCEKALANAARKIDLGRFMNMGHGEDSAGGRAKESILADCTEAIIRVTNEEKNAEAQYLPVTDGNISVFMPADSFVSVFIKHNQK